MPVILTVGNIVGEMKQWLQISIFFSSPDAHVIKVVKKQECSVKGLIIVLIVVDEVINSHSADVRSCVDR